MKYGGLIANFPQEVVERMLLEQQLQGNERDVTVFEIRKTSGKMQKGFEWDKTEAGHDFWHEVIFDQNFDLFFQRYPKSTINKYPMLMWVGDTQEQVNRKVLKRVVFMEKCGMFIAWNTAESFEEAEKETRCKPWEFAKPVTEPLTINHEQIREAFKCDEFVISEK